MTSSKWLIFKKSLIFLLFYVLHSCVPQIIDELSYNNSLPCHAGGVLGSPLKTARLSGIDAPLEVKFKRIVAKLILQNSCI